MSFLTGLLATLVTDFMTVLVNYLSQYVKNVTAVEDIKSQASADASLLEKAQTDEDKALAARKIADDTFGN